MHRHMANGTIGAPMLEVIRRQPKEILLSALARMAEQAPFYIFTAFVFSYGTAKLEVNRDFLLTTQEAYLLVRFLGKDDWYVLITADKNTATLGNLRHQADVYVERILSSLKLEGLIV